MSNRSKKRVWKTKRRIAFSGKNKLEQRSVYRAFELKYTD